jgi:hypothetical protein
MEKKSLLGVKVFSILNILVFSLFELLFIRNLIISHSHIMRLVALGCALFGILMIAASIGVLNLKNVARFCLLMLDTIAIIATSCMLIISMQLILYSYEMLFGNPDNRTAPFIPVLISISPVIFFIASIYYFTRPKVKEQFH